MGAGRAQFGPHAKTFMLGTNALRTTSKVGGPYA